MARESCKAISGPGVMARTNAATAKVRMTERSGTKAGIECGGPCLWWRCREMPSSLNVGHRASGATGEKEPPADDRPAGDNPTHIEGQSCGRVRRDSNLRRANRGGEALLSFITTCLDRYAR